MNTTTNDSVCDLMVRIAQLEAELADARKDSARLNKLDDLGGHCEIINRKEATETRGYPSIRVQLDRFFRGVK